MTDVFVVDRYEVARRGLVDLIDTSPGLRVVGEAGDAATAIDLINAALPGVVVIDVRAGHRAGVELCRAVAGGAAKCLLLADEVAGDLMFDAIRAGAAGYLLDRASSETVIHAIEAVAAGRSVLDPDLTERVFARLRTTSEQPASREQQALTPQERRVLELVATGMTNLQIAHRCEISEKTVKNHMTSILRKLNISSRTQAALFARDIA